MAKLPSLVELARKKRGLQRAPGTSAGPTDRQEALKKCTPIDDTTINKRLDGDCRFASLEEIAAYRPRLVIHREGVEVTQHLAPLEMYVADNLRDFAHQVIVGTPLSSPQFGGELTLNYPMTVDRLRKDFSVVRSGGSTGIFDAQFGQVQVDFVPLIKFVLQFGTYNLPRDGVPASDSVELRRRIDFGCGGGDYVYDGRDELGIPVPARTYSFQVFKKIVDTEERDAIKEMIASLVDAMQRCQDIISLKNGLPRSYDDPERFEKFGSYLNHELGCKENRGENVTLIVKDYSALEGIDKHNDNKDCNQVGFRLTSTLGAVIKDAEGGLLGLKVLVNSRANAGKYMNARNGMIGTLTHIRRQLEMLEHELKMFTANYRGTYPLVLGYKNFKDLYLDDDCPWERYELIPEWWCGSINLWPSQSETSAWEYSPTL